MNIWKKFEKGRCSTFDDMGISFHYEKGLDAELKKKYKEGQPDNSIYSDNEAAVYICKNKFGETGKIALNFDGAHQTFTEL